MTDSSAHFRTVLRGYDPAQVDQHVHERAEAAQAARREAAERTIQVSTLEVSHVQLRKEVDRHVQRARSLEEEQMTASAPTYATLGDRIGSILTLADEEATELRAHAQADAARHRGTRLRDHPGRASRVVGAGVRRRGDCRRAAAGHGAVAGRTDSGRVRAGAAGRGVHAPPSSWSRP